MVNLMDDLIAIFKRVKIVLSLIIGIILIIFSTINYIKTKGGFTSSDPQGILINHIRYYDERVLILLLLSGSALIFYGIYGFYAEYFNSRK